MELKITNESYSPLTNTQINELLKRSLAGRKLRKVLIIPPDITRYHSNAGYITNAYYHMLKDNCEVDILPALGTHDSMTQEEVLDMYGDIPFDRFIEHHWRTDIVKVGTVPESYVSEITEGLWNKSVTMEINKNILNPDYDLIISVGQVVPHEVIGMANHSKNIFVGCGGKSTIHESHMIGAVFGMERMMGKDFTPVRKVLDYGWQHFLKDLPLIFVLTVTTAPENKIQTHGLFIGDTRKTLEDAIVVAQAKNINFLEKGIKKCVVYLDPKEFRSTWLGNKSVYRTRMAIADDGELIVLAPGIIKFGEDEKIDELIRKYGYVGRDEVLRLFHENEDLQSNMSAAAHLIHGSSDERFKITYAVKNISLDEIRRVNFNAIDYDEALKLYPIDQLKPGYNITANNEEIYYVPNPALGLWINQEKFKMNKETL